MKPTRVTQYVADLRSGDAVSDIVRAFHRLLRGWGFDARLAAAGWGDDLRAEVEAYQQCTATADEAHLHVYHFSVACSPMTEHFRRQPGRKMLVYHNITPPEWFLGYDEGALWATGLARHELAGLRDCVEMASSYSAYNLRELEDLGFRRVVRVPLVLDFARFTTPPDSGHLERMDDGDTHLVFVGRLAPNKCQEDVIRVFWHYHRCIQPKSRLHLVGPHSIPSYVERLKGLVHDLQLDGRVDMGGRVSDAVLAATYQGSQVFVCMSEHEGFCVPLLEAMHYRVPVVAYAAGAVPDTMGDAGLLVREKRYAAIAEAVHLLVTDEALRARVIARQTERLRSFEEKNAAESLRKVLDEWLLQTVP